MAVRNGMLRGEEETINAERGLASRASSEHEAVLIMAAAR